MTYRTFRPVAVALLLTTAVGCYGGFNLTRKIWTFNKGASGNAFVRELIFLGLVIIPVYEICSLGDMIIFNSIEFWTGNNPITVMNDGPRQVIARRTADGMHLDVTEAGRTRSFDVTVTGEGAVAREGSAVVSSVTEAEGKATLRAADGRVLAVRTIDDDANAGSPHELMARILEDSPGLRVASAH